MMMRALFVWQLAFHQAACDNRLPNWIQTVHLAVIWAMIALSCLAPGCWQIQT
jgi:hypothetical protein